MTSVFTTAMISSKSLILAMIEAAVAVTAVTRTSLASTLATNPGAAVAVAVLQRGIVSLVPALTQSVRRSLSYLVLGTAGDPKTMKWMTGITKLTATEIVPLGLGNLVH